VGVGGPHAATSLAVALVARAARAGSWVAAVGLEGLGLVAAEELGLPLERLVLVATPGPSRWAATVAALLDGFDVVLLGAPARARPVEARRLVARTRERRAVLVQVGWPPGRWPEPPELNFTTVGAHWEGIGQGWGHCRARRVEVEGRGRRGASRPRRHWLWLPGPDGAPAAIEAPVGSSGGRSLVAAKSIMAVGPSSDARPLGVAEPAMAVGPSTDGRPRIAAEPAVAVRSSSGGRSFPAAS
jgi:hypothetical protein